VDFLGALHFQDFSFHPAWIVSFGASERIVRSEWEEGLHQNVIIEEVNFLLLGRLCKVIKVLNEMVVFSFGLFKIHSFRRFVLQINIIKVGKVNIHFANVVKKFGSVQGSFRL
jgi:hypothetical protein